MTKRVDETKAGKSVSAYVILNKRGKLVGKVQAVWTDGGTCILNVWDFGSDPNTETKYYEKRAGGYGYDKFTAALSGCTIDGHELTDHCGVSLKPPAGRSYFLPTFKAPKGYRLCNGTYVDITTGQHVGQIRVYKTDEQDNRLFDRYAYVTDRYPHEYEFETNPEKFTEVDPENVKWVNTSCHRDAGFDYLRALGYHVIQAI